MREGRRIAVQVFTQPICLPKRCQLMQSIPREEQRPPPSEPTVLLAVRVEIQTAPPAVPPANSEQCGRRAHDNKHPDAMVEGSCVKAALLVSVGTATGACGTDELTAQKTDRRLHRHLATGPALTMYAAAVQLAKVVRQRYKRSAWRQPIQGGDAVSQHPPRHDDLVRVGQDTLGRGQRLCNCMESTRSRAAAEIPLLATRGSD